MDEPSVLDYVIDKLTFWKKSTLSIPRPEKDLHPQEVPSYGKKPRSEIWKNLLLLMPVISAIIAQVSSEQQNRSAYFVIFFYVAAGGSLLLLILFRDWNTDPLLLEKRVAEPFTVRWIHFLIGAGVSVIAFFFFIGNLFNGINLILWATGFGLVWWSLRVPGRWLENLVSGWKDFWQNGLRITPWMILVAVVFFISAFFRFYQLNQVPPEMFSDHAEKLIDVTDVLNGQFFVFFPRNTGREAIQMYLTAAVVKIFGTGVSFLSLKLGTALAGLFTLPFIYLLGKEIKNKEVGLTAMFFAGIAYWPNVISRVALRFTLYPAFTAPTLYFLIRGLKRKSWNDFLFAGLFLGFGLHGYSTFRIVPLVVIATLVIYLIQNKSGENRLQALIALLLIGIIALIIFLPLLRFAISYYDSFSYRMLSRMTGLEKDLPGSFTEILVSNLWKSLIMFQWDNGQTWVHSIGGRPALEIISAAFFSMGVSLLLIRNLIKFSLKYLLYLASSLALLLLPVGLITISVFVITIALIMIFDRKEWRWLDLVLLLVLFVLLVIPLNWITGIVYILGLGLLLVQTNRYWNWMDIVLLAWIPLLLLPSALSIAYPIENPSLNRTGGAIIPVFLVAALAFENVLINLKKYLPRSSKKWILAGIVIFVAFLSMSTNYYLVFEKYYHEFRIRAWNSSQIGAVIRQFSDTIGDEDQAWVVRYPHWVDTRLVGIEALGRVKDYGLWPSELYISEDVSTPKLYIYQPEDEEAIETLQRLYPEGIIEKITSEVEGRDFMLYYVLE